MGPKIGARSSSHHGFLVLLPQQPILRSSDDRRRRRPRKICEKDNAQFFRTVLVPFDARGLLAGRDEINVSYGVFLFSAASQLTRDG